MSVKIASLNIENVKRIKAFYLEPTESGLTVIGGKNGQGKTSVVNSIAWGLGGNKFAPSTPQRAESLKAPEIDIVLSNGLHVKRSGKNAALTVTDPSGAKYGQALLDSFKTQFALDLPKFLNATDKEKAQFLLRVLGIGDQLQALDVAEKNTYDERTAIGRIADQKEKHAAELEHYPDVPDMPISAMELIKTHQEILARNGENQKKREQVSVFDAELRVLGSEIQQLEERIQSLQEMAGQKRQQAQTIQDSLTIAKHTAEQLQDESTAELEASLANIEAINAQVAANNAKQYACDEAANYRSQYDCLTKKIESIRQEKIDLLNGAALPLPGLTVDDGALLYNGVAWDCMSGSEQLRVAVAIVRAMSPQCGFVLIDKLEQMDVDTMREFGAWLESEGLQAIATRVSTNADECSIIIEDGLPAGETYIDTISKPKHVTVTVTAKATTNEEEYF